MRIHINSNHSYSNPPNNRYINDNYHSYQKQVEIKLIKDETKKYSK